MFKWVLAFFVLLPAMALAQETVTISGTVTTQVDGLPMPGAVVTIGGADVTATTDANGH
jgi:TonB-dependent starch-binding outer membrane protein SusC